MSTRPDTLTIAKRLHILIACIRHRRAHLAHAAILRDQPPLPPAADLATLIALLDARAANAARADRCDVLADQLAQRIRTHTAELLAAGLPAGVWITVDDCAVQLQTGHWSDGPWAELAPSSKVTG